MELTIEVHHEDHSYWAEVTGPESAGLTGCATEAGTLKELATYLEEALRICADDDTLRLVDAPLAVGTVHIEALVGGQDDAAPGSR